MKIAAILLLIAVFATANPQSEYISFMEEFMKCNELSFDFKISQYHNNETIAMKGFYKRYKNNFLIKNDDYFVITNSEYSVTIDDYDKLVLLDYPKPADNLFVMNKKEMREVLEKVTEVPTSSKGKKEWHVLAKEWEGLVVVIADYINKTPEQISIYDRNNFNRNQKPLMRIDFTKVLKGNIDKNEFAMDKIISKKGGKWVLSPKYSKYELINNLD